MQCHTSKESEIKISPNLLKNFNVYDTLVPQKNGAKSSEATTVDKLIDIDDCSRDSGFQDSDLHPAFLDKNRDFDLVDLYQNIFVTPQHIKKSEATDEVVMSDTTFSDSNGFDAGFKQFFDMLESGQKIDWSSLSQSEEETTTKHDFIEKKPRVLMPKVFTEPDSDSEDLINEVLEQKKLENLFLGSISNLPKYNPSPKDNSSELKERESPKTKKTDEIPEASRLNSINGIAKSLNIITGTNEKILRPSETEKYPVIDSTNFTVRAIQKDEKVYKKKRVVKPESQTANFIKGPDFYEKSVVLPQIMARLHARLAYLDEKSNQKRRLILDAGTKPVNAEGMSNGKAHVTKKTNNQVLSSVPKAKEPSPTKFTQNDLTKKVQNTASTSGVHSLKLNNVLIRDEARLCVNTVTKDVRVHTTDKPCMNSGNSSGAKKASVASPEYGKLNPLSTVKKVESPVAASTKTEFGKLSPVVLMEDCNKQRLRALKQSQMFKEFVLKGKFES